MREGQASTTAAFVGFSRGVGIREEGRDDHAHALVHGPLGWLLRGYERHPAARPALRMAFRVALLGMVDHIHLRTAAIDRRVQDALASGIEQVVVLGAGLDARAWRLPGVEAADIFEVDHPSTQAHKRRAVEGRLPRARIVRYVSVDFEHESFGDALLEASLDPARPTAWIWEGVTMYLPHEAIQASLTEMARVSAPGSRLLTTYLVPDSIPLWPVGPMVIEAVFRHVFGEELRGKIPSEDFAAMLAQAGFEVLDDTDSRAWAEPEGASPHGAFALRGERLNHAVLR